MKYLILGLGNDLIGDDAFGPHVVRRLTGIGDCDVTIMESAGSGLELLDIFVGFDRVLVIDGMITGNRVTGALAELRLCDLRSTPGPSPHYSGLPELVQIAKQMNLTYPDEFRILAVELKNTQVIGAGLSPRIAQTIPQTVRRVGEIVREWREQDRNREPELYGAADA